MKSIQTIKCDNDTLKYIKQIESEIQSAHNILDEFGCDKQRWSLAGRIERLLVMLQAKKVEIPQHIQETAKLFFKS